MSAIVALFIGLQKAVIQAATMAPLTVTQIILPVAIISTVVVVRHVSPPESVAPCTYKTTSMPTEGTLTFLQSFGCNMDNECLPPNYTETPHEVNAKQRFKQLDRSLNPIIGNSSKMAKIKKLPAATNAMVKIGNAAAANNLTNILNSFNLNVGSLFYNQSLVVQYLTGQTHLLTPDAAKALMNAQLNLTALISAFGGTGIADIVCDPARLNMYLSVNYEGDKNASVASQISSALCKLDPAKANNISDFLFTQFDIGKALGLFKQVAVFTYNYNLTLALNDLQTLISLMPKFNAFSSLDSLAVSQWAVGLVQQVQKVINIPGLLGDMKFISQSAEQLMGLLTALVANDPTARLQFETAKNVIGIGQRMIGFMTNLQSVVLTSTIDKILPQDAVKVLISNGVSLASMQSSPVTLLGILQLLGLNTSESAGAASQICSGFVDIRKIFASPASYPNLTDNVVHILCSNSTAVASLISSINVTRFLSDFVTAASFNATQLVSDIYALMLLPNWTDTVFTQLVFE